LTVATFEEALAFAFLDTPVTLLLELDSAFNEFDLRVDAISNFVALSSLILAAFAFWTLLSDSSS
jgi:hypothetical protein